MNEGGPSIEDIEEKELPSIPQDLLDGFIGIEEGDGGPDYHLFESLPGIELNLTTGNGNRPDRLKIFKEGAIIEKRNAKYDIDGVTYQIIQFDKALNIICESEGILSEQLRPIREAKVKILGIMTQSS